MRFRELLLEYDRAKTVANMGAALLKRLDADYQARQWLSDYLSSHPDQENSQEFRISQGLQWFEDADPTPNKSLVRWIVRTYIGSGISTVEDLMRVRNVLTKIEMLKRTGYFRRHPEHRHLSDLSKPWSLTGLEHDLDDIPASEYESEADRARQKAVLMAGEDQVDIILNTSRYKIVSPKTQAAANFYGVNTKWCTTSENGSQFKYYTDISPLYIILDKPNNNRWQFHFGKDVYNIDQDGEFDPHDHQFMDETDRRIDTLRFGIDHKEVAEALKFAMTNVLKVLFGVGDPDLHIRGTGLNFARTEYDFPLPRGLRLDGELDITRCSALSALPDNLEVGEDMFANYCTSLTTTPDNLRIGGSLEMTGCTSLISLGKGLRANSIVLDGCTGLTSLPDDMIAKQLWIEDCPGLADVKKPKGVREMHK